jgi:nicotinamide-nucleotide adenylyltransferase
MKDNIIRGLMIGRFQPFHKGHFMLVKQILEDCDEIIIVVGSAQLNYKFTDPFTAGERILMIQRALLESDFDLSKVFIIPLIDDDNNARWFSYLLSMVPSFDILYSGNELVSALASSKVKLTIPHFVKKKQYNGSNIRNRISSAKNWKDLVPKGVSTIIEKINGVNRIKTMASYDKIESSKSIQMFGYRDVKQEPLKRVTSAN